MEITHRFKYTSKSFLLYARDVSSRHPTTTVHRHTHSLWHGACVYVAFAPLHTSLTPLTTLSPDPRNWRKARDFPQCLCFIDWYFYHPSSFFLYFFFVPTFTFVFLFTSTFLLQRLNTSFFLFIYFYFSLIFYSFSFFFSLEVYLCFFFFSCIEDVYMVVKCELLFRIFRM